MDKLAMVITQGRLGERVDGLADGARITGEGIAKHFDFRTRYVGEPEPARIESFTQSFDTAKPTLDRLHQVVTEELSTHSGLWLCNNTCSASIASLSAMGYLYEDLKVLYIDAHPDFNRPQESETGYLGGTALAAACRLWDSGFPGGIDPSNVLFYGIRDIDAAENKNISDYGCTVLDSNDPSTQQLVSQIPFPLVVHIDWDSTNPDVIPADYAVPGGLQVDQIIRLTDSIRPQTILATEFSEYKPDTGRRSNDEVQADILRIARSIERKFR